jgi:hypothetical protein
MSTPMTPKVKIYVLVDPITLKVRYIGRTKGTLKKRLAEHVCKAKKNYSLCSHVANWIRSLLKMNCKPFIRQIAEVEGWTNSYEFERFLINKYKDRLVNHDDRGEGGLQRNFTPELKVKISNSLKKFYSTNIIKTCTEVHAYNYDGTYYKSYHSIKAASIDTGVYHGTISKQLCGRILVPRKTKFQFNYAKVEQMTDFENRKYCRFTGKLVE